MFCPACATFNADPNLTGHCSACAAELAVGMGSRPERAASPYPPRWAVRTEWNEAEPRARARRLVALLPLLVLLGLGLSLAGRYQVQRADQARWYAAGVDAAESGRYIEAASAFEAAGGYRDADDQRAAMVAQLDSYRAAYLDGVVALDAARYEDAIAALTPIARDLPDYEDVALLLSQARDAREAELLREAGAAEARRDWLAAERALAELAASDPEDPEIASRLARIRRDHAPLVLGRESGLYLVSPDLGEEHLVTDAVVPSWPVWSPDRTRIAFVSVERGMRYDAALYVVNADGTGLTKLAEGLSPYRWPVWSPDGAQLAYTSLADYDRERRRGTIAIHAVEVATGKVTDLTGEHLEHANSVTWSPSGDRVAFVSIERTYVGSTGQGNFEDGDVYVLTLATGEIANVTDGQLPDVARVAWSPAGERLLIQSMHDFSGYGPDSASIHLLDLATSELTEVTLAPGHVSMPVWSPDGTRFAFVEGNAVIRVREQGPGEMWINARNQITDFLTWSPDGSALIAIGSGSEQASLLIPLADSSGSQTVIRFAYKADRYTGAPPQWSPLQPTEPAVPSVAGTALDPGHEGR